MEQHDRRLRLRWVRLIAAALALGAGLGALVIHLGSGQRDRAVSGAALEQQARHQRSAVLLAEARATAAGLDWGRALSIAEEARRAEESPSARLWVEVARGQAATRGPVWKGRADAIGFGPDGAALAVVIDAGPAGGTTGSADSGAVRSGPALRVIELASGLVVGQIPLDLPATEVAFGRGSYATATSGGGTLTARVAGGGARVFGIPGGELLATLDLPQGALVVAGPGAPQLLIADRGLLVAGFGTPRERLTDDGADPYVLLEHEGTMGLALRKSGLLETWHLERRKLVSEARDVREPASLRSSARVSSGEGGVLLLHREGARWQLGAPASPAAALASGGAWAATAPEGPGTPGSPRSPGLIALWDLTERRRALVLPAPTGGARLLALSSDGRRLVAAGESAVEQWSLPSRPELPSLLAAVQPRLVAFAPSGLLIALDESSLNTYAIDAGGLQHRGRNRLAAPPPGAQPALAFSAAGLHLAAAGADGTHVLALGPAGSTSFSARLAEASGGVALSADAERLTVAGAEALQAFAVRTERRLWTSPLACAAIAVASPEGAPEELFCAGRDGALRRLDPATGEERARLGAVEGPAALAVSADGGLLASAAAGGVLLWPVHAAAGRAVTAALPSELAAPASGSPAAAGTVPAASGSAAPTPAAPAPLQGTAQATAVAFSSSGTVLAVGNRSGALQLWSVPGGELLVELPRLARAVTSVSFSPLGVALAATCEEGPGVRLAPVPEWLGAGR